ncbi:putative entry exclusion protein TrbK-alt [Gluconacetobacter diazotrophicus]|uniref:Putative entry exclusion protein TrbK-alt n=1 Tax=Gluconacetobacter diazotrophicus TaxID=33996 RepID=A0A7W4NPI7_GLUDI|nr:putative entry exclusion protein TrbK-alt [Gluconacetobacter diazotrophicus]MBB2158190.1 putative entry exclusion protein TrbK-alt [Gluconacetobacter diazotrophicus]
MRWPRLSPPVVFRLVAGGLVVLILVAAGLHLRHLPRDVGVPDLGPPGSYDPLAAGLARCQALGMKADGDPACAAIWAENRKRFFAPETAR